MKNEIRHFIILHRAKMRDLVPICIIFNNESLLFIAADAIVCVSWFCISLELDMDVESLHSSRLSGISLAQLAVEIDSH